ncbi:DUF2334 domain-containing protein [Viridibacillus arvi]|uniref:DUF2334 domain-containing protein n=1 Tax=Viridibacillus arvi TaxID=263475 RepID=UPI00187B3F6A|nr:DUF2334 domain-containing protein [Viridibacillus sp. JNUCC-6]QOV09628.1 DUF2334 domain-containing protein [Viridibacillus sp. JNUCC-6]
MNYKRLFLGISIIIVMCIQSIPTFASVSKEQKKPAILVAYQSTDGIANSDILFLETIFAGISDQVQLSSVQQVTIETIKNIDVVVFVGEDRSNLPKQFLNAIKQFKGHLIALGKNAEQLPRFEKWQFLGSKSLRTLDGEPLSKLMNIEYVKPPKGSEVLVEGTNLNAKYPVIVKDGNTSFIAKTNFLSNDNYILSRELFNLLDLQEPIKHLAYIRLEDISPISDPKLVKETGEYLAQKGIPFYMALIPVYVNSESGEQVQLKDNKELVKVLQHLQRLGGMVIAHGYTHSYRYTETGEGFEFWDSINNQKISSISASDDPIKMKKRADFSTKEAYQHYLGSIDEIEKKYIEDKIKLSIEKLTELKLYPISFEAPHYAMSSTGYDIIAQHFTSIFGQVQLSDDTWKRMGAPLMISKPSLLSDMTLYPETIGFIDPSRPEPLKEMEEKIKKVQQVPGSVIGGFYHPYLGMEYLPEMVSLIEEVPNLEWLDLRKSKQIVQSENTMIQQEDGELKVVSNIKWTDKVKQRMGENPFEMVLWILAIIVALFVIAFFIYVVSLRTKLRKRLFEERNING